MTEADFDAAMRAPIKVLEDLKASRTHGQPIFDLALQAAFSPARLAQYKSELRVAGVLALNAQS